MRSLGSVERWVMPIVPSIFLVRVSQSAKHILSTPLADKLKGHWQAVVFLFTRDSQCRSAIEVEYSGEACPFTVVGGLRIFIVLLFLCNFQRFPLIHRAQQDIDVAKRMSNLPHTLLFTMNALGVRRSGCLTPTV